MRTRKKEEAEKTISPDCRTCLAREECDKAEENHFCPRWISREPEPQGIDPNAAWQRGDEVEF